MSFLQIISQNKAEKPFNPALVQLQKSRNHSKWSRNKSEPKQFNDQTIKIALSKEMAQSNLLELKKSPKKRICFKNINPSINQKQKQCSSPEDIVRRSRHRWTEPLKKQQSMQEHKSKNHASFSFYLSKNLKSSNSGSTIKKKNLQYFDLDELAGSIASAKILQKKIDEQLLSPPKRKDYLNLSHFQYFLQNIQKDKGRYHEHGNKDSTQESQVQVKPTYYQLFPESRDSRIRPRSLWKRQFSEKQERDRHGHIVPWHQNEEEHSPMKYSHYKSRKQMFQSNQIFHEMNM